VDDYFGIRKTRDVSVLKQSATAVLPLGEGEEVFKIKIKAPPASSDLTGWAAEFSDTGFGKKRGFTFPE